jgi:metallo-beta-lactamase class B
MRPHKVVLSLLFVLLAAIQGSAQTKQGAQAKSAQDAGAVVRGQTKRDYNAPFPAHKVIGNVYYVGTEQLATFLITTPQGHILINSDFEATVPAIRASVEKLGFKFIDIKILLGSHAHGDHMEGDALVKELTGAQVVSMAEDVPALKAMKPGGKEHPIDRIIHDGDTVQLGGATLIAHLTAGHTRGATAWTMPVTEAGKTVQVVFYSSLRSPEVLTAPVIDEFQHSFAVVRTLPCDVPLGDHPAEYGMAEKYAKLKPGAPNPFIDPSGCRLESNMQEAMFKAILAEQQNQPERR